MNRSRRARKHRERARRQAEADLEEALVMERWINGHFTAKTPLLLSSYTYERVERALAALGRAMPAGAARSTKKDL